MTRNDEVRIQWKPFYIHLLLILSWIYCHDIFGGIKKLQEFENDHDFERKYHSLFAAFLKFSLPNAACVTILLKVKWPKKEGTCNNTSGISNDIFRDIKKWKCSYFSQG